MYTCYAIFLSYEFTLKTLIFVIVVFNVKTDLAEYIICSYLNNDKGKHTFIGLDELRKNVKL